MAKKIKPKVKKSKGLKEFDIAMQYYNAGNFPQAEMLCRQILQSETDNPEVLHIIGLIAGRVGRYDDAIDLISKAIYINPRIYSYHNNLGMALRYKGHIDDAIRSFKKAIELKHDFAGAYNNLGIAFADKGMVEEATAHYMNALKFAPDYAEAYFNLGCVFKDKGMIDEAIENYKKALMLKSNYAEAYNNLGNALKDKGILDEATENLKKALILKPDFAEAYNNLGLVLAGKGLLDESIENYQMALKIRPDYAEAHFNMSLILLRKGDFNNGWKKYEWRLKTIPNQAPPLVKHKWDGSSVEGKVILVHAEQGYGDVIQFARYLPVLHESGAKKVLLKLNNKGLEQLLRENNLKSEILESGTSIENLEYDTNIHLVSLPRIFKTNLENMPFKRKRYLKANPEKVKRVREKFFDLTLFTLHAAPFNIGIFWQGSIGHKQDRNRSVSLYHFYRLCRLSGVKIYSLQKGYGLEQLNNLPEDIEILNLGETFNDFSDTAAAIENLDMTISIDTAVAHLSGALGKKTWILLPPYGEWRWFTGMDYSPWYEDVKLFRHREPGRKDWDEMMERVLKQVEEEIKNR